MRWMLQYRANKCVFKSLQQLSLLTVGSVKLSGNEFHTLKRRTAVNPKLEQQHASWLRVSRERKQLKNAYTPGTHPRPSAPRFLRRRQRQQCCRDHGRHAVSVRSPSPAAQIRQPASVTVTRSNTERTCNQHAI